MSASAPYPGRMDRSPGNDTPKKRRKGATRLSCAECRRLKLRCDRSIPCSSCIKRGCGAICPDGSLTTGQGNRFVLASTQELHEKISELASRVRELEDGLRDSHNKLSNDQHPLLSDDLLKIKAPLQREVSHKPANAVKEEESNPDVVDAFGSLSISVSGRSNKYYGQIANSWLFLQNELSEEGDQDNHLISLQNILPPDILNRAASLPISPLAQAENVGLQKLYWYLPTVEVARELCAIYYSHAAWMYDPISKDAFENDVFALFYNYNSSVAAIPEEAVSYHRLALLFLVFSIGSLMNTNLPAYNLEAEKFNQLARAALFHTNIFLEPTVHAVQALYLMTYYLFLADRHGPVSNARWATLGLAVKVGQSIGLHRDSGKWKTVDPDEIQRRRELFWELFTYDSWQCYTYGRPPSFALPHFDCKLPFPSDVTDEHAFHSWKHRFASECMMSLHDQAFGAKMPTYATVLQLDRKLRAFPVPPVLQVAGFGSTEPRPVGFVDSVSLTLQRHIVLAIRESSLLYLHRSFFARAISDHPKDPLGSPYGTSVIAAYRSAGSLVAMMRNLHSALKEPSERIWFLWTHMFSCAIVLGSIVTRCPSMSLAPSALVQLDSACELFSKAARGFRAGAVLEIMLNLKEKAHMSLEEFRRGKAAPPTRHVSADGTIVEADDDELAVLGGKTRLISKKEPLSPTLTINSPSSLNPVVPLPLSPESREQLAPDILEYLGTFNNGAPQMQRHPASSSAFSNDSGQDGSFSDNDLSPSTMYGMSTMPSQTYHTEPTSYMQQQSMQGVINTSQQGMGSRSQNTTFPAYFPVYDYGAIPNGSNLNANNYGIMLDSSPIPGQRRASSSPDNHSNMHSAWQEFVSSFTPQVSQL